ncbi:hypothetical protein JET14_04530 [Martelella lutilitoris]|uniref:Uncharacterized protein n=1 Tax=Martelella lutilitoris TaxID=2583532 RepID=A0A7T7KM48_9HYPH|nr:hypothetical protein [Martelella lutilitoris]QQM31442.1 hypothetical protein JET14_04530 [Martelella lutilitoris]
MENIRTVFMAIVGLAAVAFVTVFAASIGLALIAVLAVLTVARMIAVKLNHATVPVRTRDCRKRDGMRVWDDGRGKIIDL